MILDLTTQNWTLKGWRPFVWQTRQSMELGLNLEPEFGPIAATIPGSPMTALLAAGIIKDWNVGLNSRDCQWVEHFHWEFVTEIDAGQIPAGQTVSLFADGLDYSGWILVDMKIVAEFSGTMLPHRFDVTPYLGDGKSHQMSILFDLPPEEQGQMGFTSRSQFFKPRFSYSWDWCPRIVPVGVWDRLRIEAGCVDAELISVSSTIVDADGVVGIEIDSRMDNIAAKIAILFAGRQVAETTQAICSGKHKLSVRIPNPERWWPNSEGPQALYQVAITLEADGKTSHFARRVGFKQVRWLPCKGAPADALPWICEINGQPIFLQGVNWTPMRADYLSHSREEYTKWIALYRDMGCNLLRVWGGAFIEREMFFDLCDEAGILVWQEFPLSSSGIDNWPPEAPEAISSLCEIARSAIRRRGHHASKLMWCGGNELQGNLSGLKVGVGKPVDLTHPCMAALAKIVTEEDPGVRFVPSSASGPRFMADEKDFGRGLHHDVHGPWGPDGSLDAWRIYWAGDDALFRSEVGTAGMSPLELIERVRGDCDPWPPNKTNPYWRHSSMWWVQWDRFKDQVIDLSPTQAMRQFAELSQSFQAEALSIAAAACKSKFPCCGGFIVWMGHDCFPCLANTSIIDFDGNPKPAYYALAKVFNWNLR